MVQKRSHDAREYLLGSISDTRTEACLQFIEQLDNIIQ